MPGNMNNLMKQAQKMQKQMEENQKALEEKEFTAAAGGGAVEVTISGKKEVTKVKISEDAMIRSGRRRNARGSDHGSNQRSTAQS